MFASIVPRGLALSHALRSGRRGWIQVAAGSIRVNGETLGAGDGAAIEAERSVSIEGIDEESELLLFDMAG